MTLSFIDSWTTPDQLEDWPLPGSPYFARSRAYEIFLRELRRYTLEEVGGRSFLIAGHRGAGKTALVAQALRQLTTEMLQASIDPTTRTISRRGRLQRPLIVNLAAQSLIAPPAPAEKPKAKPKPKPKPNSKQGGVEDDASDEDAAEVPAEEKPLDEVGSALVHITIALYRALAREVSRGFSIHSRAGDADGRADRAELGAQLLLDLDDAPEPALLRRKWKQLDRLAGGILWPARTGGTLQENGITDQGLREIVAVATAAQVFQVVSGVVTYQVKSIDSATRDRETKSSLDIKDLVGRLGAVFAGTAAGGTALVTKSAEAPLAVGLGLLVWLASSFALGTSATSKDHRERKRDYTFLRDRSIQTLDRELPQVIERIREAGLAPVFVLDELDKLPNPQATIGLIINRLKHIVSDFSFFCFLANRDYFDALERLVAAEAYPSEHTYFSERLFILNRPGDLFDYVVTLVQSDAKDRDEDNLPRATFALVSIYRSKLNFTDLNRELNRNARPDSSLTLTPQEFRERRDLRLAAAIQLAFDEALRAEPFANRFANDEAFAQLAADALYYLPRRWEADPSQPIDMSQEALNTYLVERSRGGGNGETGGSGDDDAVGDGTANASELPPNVTDPPKPGAAAAVSDVTEGGGSSLPTGAPAAASQQASAPQAAVQNGRNGNQEVSPPDLELVMKIVERQLVFLSDWKKLADALRDRPRPDRWRLDEIVPQEIGSPLVEAVAGAPHKYRFLLDETAMPRQVPAPSKPALSEDKARSELLEFIRAFNALLQNTDLALDALVRAGYMPATVTSATLADAEHVLTGSDPSAELFGRARGTVELLRQALRERQRLLSYALVALVQYRSYLGDNQVAAADTLLVLARYFSPAGRETSADGLSTFERIADALAGQIVGEDLTTARGVRALAAALLKLKTDLAKTKPALPTPDEMARAWVRWLGNLTALFEEGRSFVEIVEPVDVITAVRGEGPGRLFRSDLATMTVRDWSELVLAAFPLQEGSVGDAPLWACFAGLRAIGFDAGMLETLAGGAAQEMGVSISQTERETINRIVARALVNQPPGLLFLAESDGEPILSGSEAPARPILVVASSSYPRYEKALDWLAIAGAFEGVADETR